MISIRRLMLLTALVALHQRAGAQEASLPGRLLAREEAPGDSTQHVAVYLPSHYDGTRAAPVLFVLDPRGRAQLALQLFAGAAERHGWIVVSSYNSASDTGDDPNVEAMNGMLAWAQARARMDTARLYIAGFSGTSRIAWALASQLHGRVAGIFGTGGGVSFSGNGPEMVFGADSTFAFFGSAGTTDFNYDEMRWLATRLRLARVPSRMAWFHGPHSWPPRWLCEQGIDWLELRAILGGRRVADHAFVTRAIAHDADYADSLERTGQWDAAETRYREIGLDVPTRPEGARARDLADELAGREPLRALRERARSLARDDQEAMRREFEALREARTSRVPLEPETLLDKLGVASLRRRAASRDSLERDSATRRLSNIGAWLAYYEPRAFLSSADPIRAARSLRAAAILSPLRGESCDLVRITAQILPRGEDAQLPSCP